MNTFVRLLVLVALVETGLVAPVLTGSRPPDPVGYRLVRWIAVWPSWPLCSACRRTARAADSIHHLAR